MTGLTWYGLAFPPYVLKVHELADAWVCKDVVTPAYSRWMESKRASEGASLFESQINRG